MSVLQKTLSRWTENFSPAKNFSVTSSKVIGIYTYLETDKIGDGFSASVYKGHNTQTGDIVAIKVINMKMLQKQQFHVSLLNSEIETLKLVANQQNILHLYDTYSTKNNVYIITECCQTDLSKILKKKQKFSLLESLDIISQVLSGYLSLSQKGFIHRDLKPANILYKKGIYMIGDFGFAALAGTIKNNSQYNVGSPLYMAPESLEDSKYNFSTDMWAIGIILYEMIVGKTPWYADDQKQLYHKIAVKPIIKLLQDIPIQCRDFIKGVLSFNPKQRLSPSQALQWLNYFIQMVQTQLESTVASPRPELKQNYSFELFSAQSQFLNNNTNELPLPPSPKFKKSQLKKQRPVSPFRVRIPKKSQQQCLNQPNTPMIFNQPVQYKIRTLHYYCKFIHRILLILTSPLEFQFSSSQTLQRYLVDLLLYKSNKLQVLSSDNNWCGFTHLQAYLSNPNKQLQRAIKKAYVKYTQMYESDNKNPTIELTIVQKSIHELRKYLQKQFDDKSILLMDYLTTLYQLFDLQQRYDINKFCSLCKLHSIMERSPTNQICIDHLQQLLNKIGVLGI